MRFRFKIKHEFVNTFFTKYKPIIKLVKKNLYFFFQRKYSMLKLN